MVRKNMPRIFFSCIFLVLCSFLASAEDSSASEESCARTILATAKEFRIPFVMDSTNHIPCISVSVSETPLNMGIAVFSDSFAEDSEIYLSGVNKLEVNGEIYEWTRQKAAFMYNKPYELVTDDDLRKVMFSRNIYFTLNDTCIEGKALGSMTATYFITPAIKSRQDLICVI